MRLFQREPMRLLEEWVLIELLLEGQLLEQLGPIAPRSRARGYLLYGVVYVIFICFPQDRMGRHALVHVAALASGHSTHLLVVGKLVVLIWGGKIGVGCLGVSLLGREFVGCRPLGVVGEGWLFELGDVQGVSD
jgi:hypothetical protein